MPENNNLLIYESKNFTVDIQAIKNLMEKLIKTDKYLPEKWGV